MSHVLIIGGGFAGLAAGVALGARGFRVALLESKPALGGRASTRGKRAKLSEKRVQKASRDGMRRVDEKPYDGTERAVSQRNEADLHAIERKVDGQDFDLRTPSRKLQGETGEDREV